MKKLICAKDVEHCVQNGETVILIDSNTLITPSARDAAAQANITFREGGAAGENGSAACPAAQPASDNEIIYKALQILLEKGLLGQLANLPGLEVPYVSESDGTGMLKLVRGNTAAWQPLDTGHAGDQVYYNELITSGDGVPLTAGFMKIEGCSFSWDVALQEIYYVIEGVLTVEKDGRVFTAHAGDCLLFKRGAHLTFGTPEQVKVFYVTH